MEEVIDDFDDYAQRVYLPAVAVTKSKDEDLYAGLRYIVTRNIRDLDNQLYEQFTIRRKGKLGRKIKEACFEALMKSVTRKDKLARFFIELTKYPENRSSEDYVVEGISRIGYVGFETAFEMLRDSDNGTARFRIAILIARASKTRRPQSATFWKTASEDERDAVIDDWRARLIQRGLVRPDPSSTPQPADVDLTDTTSNAHTNP